MVVGVDVVVKGWRGVYDCCLEMYVGIEKRIFVLVVEAGMLVRS